MEPRVRVDPQDIQRFRFNLDLFCRQLRESNGLTGYFNPIDDRFTLLGERGAGQALTAWLFALLADSAASSALVDSVRSRLPAHYASVVLLTPSYRLTPQDAVRMEGQGVFVNSGATTPNVQLTSDRLAPKRHHGRRASPDRPAFRKTGGLWEIHFDGESGSFSSIMGMDYLAKLLAQPNKSFSPETLKGLAAQLTNNPNQKALASDSAEIAAGEVALTGESHQELADEEAVNACRQRLTAIEGEREAARYSGDTERIDDLDSEEAKIQNYLRTTGSAHGKRRLVSNKGRSTFNSVKQAIERAIDRFESTDPPMTGLVAPSP